MCQVTACQEHNGAVRNGREDGPPVCITLLELLMEAGRFLSQRRAVDDKLLLGVEAKVGVELVVQEGVDTANAAVDRFGSQVQVLADMACIEEQAAVRALVIAPDHAVRYGCPDECDRAQLDHLLVAAQMCDVLQRLCPRLDELQLMLDGEESVDPWLQASDRPDHEIGLKGMAGAPRRYGAQSTRALCDSLDALRAPQEKRELIQRQCIVVVQAKAVTLVDCGPKVDRRDDQRSWFRQVNDGHTVIEWQFKGWLRQPFLLVGLLLGHIDCIACVMQKLLSRIHRS